MIGNSMHGERAQGWPTSALAILALGSVLPYAIHAESIEAPEVRPGDTWTYRETTERGEHGWNQVRQDVTVTRVTASTIFLTVQPSGSTQPPRETFVTREWSRVRDVNGKETTVNRPLAFPLAPGKTWTLAYEEQNPNKNHKLEKWEVRYTVAGWEPVEVPAGQFRALKIEAEGTWHATVAPGAQIAQGAESTSQGITMSSSVEKTTEHEASGRLYKAVWYVPQIKRWVKSIDEYYSSRGVRNERYTTELEAFKAAAGGE